MPKHEPRELQDGQGLRCTGCCTGCTLPGHSCREVQARLDGLYGAIYEERDRLVDHLGQVQTLLVQTRARVMNNDLAVADPHRLEAVRKLERDVVRGARKVDEK